MATLSKAQRELVSRIEAGGQVMLSPQTGQYVIREGGMNGELKQMDQRPVNVLLQSGVLQQDMVGVCKLVAAPIAKAPDATTLFSEGQDVLWDRTVRGVSKGPIGAVVVQATPKQVRIRTGESEYHNVRPDALRPSVAR